MRSLRANNVKGLEVYAHIHAMHGDAFGDRHKNQKIIIWESQTRARGKGVYSYHCRWCRPGRAPDRCASHSNVPGPRGCVWAMGCAAARRAAKWCRTASTRPRRLAASTAPPGGTPGGRRLANSSSGSEAVSIDRTSYRIEANPIHLPTKRCTKEAGTRPRRPSSSSASRYPPWGSPLVHTNK